MCSLLCNLHVLILLEFIFLLPEALSGLHPLVLPVHQLFRLRHQLRIQLINLQDTRICFDLQDDLFEEEVNFRDRPSSLAFLLLCCLLHLPAPHHH